MGLLDAFKQYVKDAMPGGLLNSEWTKTAGSTLLDFTPVVGGIKGAKEEWEAGNPGWAAFNAATVPLDAISLGGATLAKSAMLKGVPALAAMTAWHGSPHKFDKFSLGKIGTGEGAQAYGHGLYLAEHPATAEVYASKLANGGAMPMPPTPKDFMVDGSRYVRQDGSLFKQVGDSADMLPVGKDEYGASLRKAQKVYEDKRKAGNLYKTDIPDEAVARFLDWDKPLSQQSPEVQAAMSQVIAKKNPRLAQYLQESAGLDEAGQTAVRKRLGVNIFDTLDTGGAAYQAAGQGGIENTLKSLGVPGIRYLDGVSRGAGQGSSNFVVFDPEMIRILERNGQATGQVPWNPGEYGLLGGKP